MMTMMKPKTRRLPHLGRLTAGLLTAVLLALPTPAMAQYGDDAEGDLIRDADGRLRGYEQSGIVLEGGSTFLPYAAFFGLAVVAAGVMFKSARRTHLD